MTGVVAGSRRTADLRRRMRRYALKGSAAVARKMMERTAVRRDYCPVPSGSALLPIPGDKGLPILGHAPAVATRSHRIPAP